MRPLLFLSLLILFTPLATRAGEATNKPSVKINTVIVRTARRPVFGGFSIGMSLDSAVLILKNIAKRTNTLQLDSATLLESDSITLYGQPAYIRLQVVNKRVKTMIINFHPLAGERYLNIRNTVVAYMEQFYGKGVKIQNESVLYHRWQTEDGTMEVSHSDKYTRVFIRLGKPQHL